MSQDGEINLTEVKAKYSVKDFYFIDSRELYFANEFRLYFEIGFYVGLALMGFVVAKFNWPFFVVALIFLIFGLWNLWRYLSKCKEFKTEKESRFNDFEILSGLYGLGDNLLNVTLDLKKRVCGGKLRITASNEIAGDPVLGKIKYLTIKYIHNGKEHIEQIREGETIELP